MAWSPSDFNFKKLFSRRITSSSKQFYEEEPDNGQNIHISEIWSDTLSSDPSVSILAGFVQLFSLTSLTEDITVADGRCYYVFSGGLRVKDFISEKFGTLYRAKLFDANNVEIFPTDPCGWMFDYHTGTVLFNGSSASFAKPLKITAYKYVGRKGGSGLDESITPNWSNKHTFKGGVEITSMSMVGTNKVLPFSVDGCQIGILDDGVYLGGMRVTTDRLEMVSFAPQFVMQDDFHADVNNCFTAISASGQYIVVLTWSECYLSHDYGETWFSNKNPKWSSSSKVTSGKWVGFYSDTVSVMAYGVCMSGDGKTIYVFSNSSQTDKDGIWASYDYGNNWVRKMPKSSIGAWAAGTGVFNFLCSTDGKSILLTAMNGVTGGVFLSTDFGTTFSRVNFNPAATTGTYPLGIISPNGRTLIVGGHASRGVWLSRDGGVTFIDLKTINPLIGASSYGYASSDGRFIILASGAAGWMYVHISMDYGATWQSTPQPAASVSVPLFGNISGDFTGRYLLAQRWTGVTNEYVLHRSTDFGKTWVDTGMPVRRYDAAKPCISYDAKVCYCPTYYRQGFWISRSKTRLRSDLRVGEVDSTSYKLGGLSLFDRKTITVVASTGIYNFVFVTEGLSDHLNNTYSVSLTMNGDNSRKCWAITNTKTMTGFVIELIQGSGVPYDAAVGGSVVVDVLIIRL